MVGVWHNNEAKILQDPSGKLFTPSVVGFKKDGVHVGSVALNLIVKNPGDTLYDAKRLIGRRFDDKDV